MPTLLSETDVKLERADMLKRVILAHRVSRYGYIVPPSRKPGLHLSGLLKYVAAKSRISDRLTEIADEEHPWRWALGQAWEEFAASLYPEMVWQPGELDDPLVMNCDGLSSELDDVDSSYAVVDEFKHNRSRKYSGADLIRKKWLWMRQGLGYCLGYGPRVVRWHVMSTMEFPDPVYTKYLVRFSEEEVDGMRRMIEMNREGAIREGFAE